jgi:hypothetical protein
MPLVEEEVGKSLGGLIERNVSELKRSLGWEEVTAEQGHWLLQTVFWLVSGKILHDKQVPKFANLDLTDVDEVFHLVGNHYGAKPLAARSRKRREALRESARNINKFSSLALTTTEALAYVYENALISKQTRSDLGTHSTPSFLVDYVVGSLADWVKEIPVNERSVYEPACGHAAFLVSAMRLLTELLLDGKATPSKRGAYLRSRLHGTDIDPFALELARLSLTLTDIPNPDGWDLQPQDMFLDNRLVEQAKGKTILLANPPFDNFTPEKQRLYRDRKCPIRFRNKAAEMLWRVLPLLPDGGVFGVVLPQSFLHSDNARDLREFLIQECELREICLFPDKVFAFSDAESAVLVGRRKKASGQNQVRYRRVRERQLQSFRSNYAASTTRTVLQSRFSHDESFSLRVPDLEDLWSACVDSPTLADIAVVEQGLIYHGYSRRRGSIVYSKEPFPGGHEGFALFDHGLQLHQLPRICWLTMDPAVIRWTGSRAVGGISQVILNYAPASRGPWRLKALIDRQGHPITSNFIAVRPIGSSCSLQTLWALLNSPIANAYAFSHLGRRHNIVGDIRKIPVPGKISFEGVEHAANAYLEAASSQTDVALLRELLLHVDCEVLRLYSLPLELEHSLLALFNEWERVGVPFKQTRYLPAELSRPIRFSDFLQFEEDWLATNRERGELIDEEIADTLNVERRARLDALQAYTDYHLNQIAPRPIDTLDELEGRLLSSMAKKDTSIR